MSEPMLPPQVWAALEGQMILDPDGWRDDNAPPFNQVCTEDDYRQRVFRCTIGPISGGWREWGLKNLEKAIQDAVWF